MKVRFLKNVTAPMKSTWYHDDSCGCSGAEWREEFFSKDEESEATVDQRAWEHLDGVVDVSGLKYREDYDIIEYP
jgi:hypothetical protein